MSLTDLYKKHLTRLVDFYKGYCAKNNLDAVLVHYGDHELYFNDDQEKSFRPNPFAVHLVPEPTAVSSVIKVAKDGQVDFFAYEDNGYWNVPFSLDLSLYEQAGVKVTRFNVLSDLNAALEPFASSSALVTPNPHTFADKGFKSVNDKELILDLEELRLEKTEFEYELLCQAQYLAIEAHRALKKALKYTNLSENELFSLYNQAARLPADKQGYSGIFAYNEHGAVLHYNVLDFDKPAVQRSFLVDAGAVHKGYNADISRTYCLDGNELFSDLILGVANVKDDIIAAMRPGVETPDLQILMHQRLAELLIDAEIVKGLSVEEAFEKRIPHNFCPHGFGHSMGIGVHDVLGRPKHQQRPGLRHSHTLTVGNVWTIEPGLYFIKSLLEGLRNDPAVAGHIDWNLVDKLLPYGGIRVEDNVYLGQEQLINLTGSLESL